MAFSGHVGTIKSGLSYSNRSLLKKWHILDLVCSVHVVTFLTGLAISIYIVYIVYSILRSAYPSRQD